MSGRAVLLVLGGLLALLGLQFGLAFTPVPRLLLEAIALLMVLTVSVSFMRLRAAGALAAVFAAAGVFWLCVMLGLGSMDPATRTDIPIVQLDVRAPNGGFPPH